VCPLDSSIAACPQSPSSRSLGTCAGIGVGVAVGVLCVAVAVVFLFRWFRRAVQRHTVAHGELTEQLLATERERLELELEGRHPPIMSSSPT
jgi:hypothetical protein